MNQEFVLNDLPKDHPIRNTRLDLLDPVYAVKGSKGWRPMFPTFGIAKKTFNDLTPVWTSTDLWKTSNALAQELHEDWLESRVDIIGQNGNDGLVYQHLPIGNDL